MAQIDIPIERHFTAQDFDSAWALLSDTRACLAHYPKLETLTSLGDNQWRWEFEPIGTRGFSHRVCYAVTYHYDREAGTIRWDPIPGEGNAVVSGAFRLTDDQPRTAIELTIDCCLEIAAPRLLSSMIGPFARKEFEGQIDRFVANLDAAINR